MTSRPPAPPSHTPVRSLATGLGLLATLVMVLVGCSGESSLDTDSAAAGLDEMIAASGIDTSADTGADDGFVDLDRCPHDPGGALLARAFDGLDNPDVVQAQRGELAATASIITAGQPVLLACDRFAEESGAGLLVSPAPDDFDAYLDQFVADDDGVTTLTLARLGTSEHRGGTLHRICADSDEGTEFDYCEVDWLDDNLLVTVYVAGPTSRRVDIEALEAGLVGVLDDLLTSLAAEDPSA